MKIREIQSLFVLLVFIVIAGCATEAKYKAKLNTFLGVSMIDLVRQWGPPQQTYELEGHKFLIYQQKETAYVPGSPPSYTTQFIGNTAYTTSYGGSPGMFVNLSCTTTFEIAESKIVNWSVKGNDCVSR